MTNSNLDVGITFYTESNIVSVIRSIIIQNVLNNLVPISDISKEF